jgi:hypothetical protein
VLLEQWLPLSLIYYETYAAVRYNSSKPRAP